MRRGRRLRTEDWSELKAIFLSSSIISFVILPNTSSGSDVESASFVEAADDDDDDEEKGGDEEGMGVDGNGVVDDDGGWLR